MTLPPPDNVDTTPPRWKPLSILQRRILGVMVEKAKTTPAAYPMTLNAITIGCNQKNNREPVMTLDTDDVEQVLHELCGLGAASELDGIGRVSKYRHHGYDWLRVNRAEMAVLAELLLRGEQSLGDLRARAARMEPIADLTALRPIVDGLIQRGLMVELTAAGRGQIVTHNLYWDREMAELRARYQGHVSMASADEEDPAARRAAQQHPARSPVHGGDGATSQTTESANTVTPVAFAELSREIADLRSEVDRLREHVRELEARLTAALG